DGSHVLMENAECSRCNTWSRCLAGPTRPCIVLVATRRSFLRLICYCARAFLRAVRRHKVQNLCSLVLGETIAPFAAHVCISRHLSVIKGDSYAKSGSADDISGGDRRRCSPASAGASPHSEPRAGCRRRLRSDD